MLLKINNPILSKFKRRGTIFQTLRNCFTTILRFHNILQSNSNPKSDKTDLYIQTFY